MRYLLVLLLLTGCSTYSTVTVPAGESTVISTPPDTSVLEELPPADIEGTRTEPVEIAVYADTTTRPTVDLSFLEVDRSDPDDETATARVKKDSTTIETTFRLPEEGEELKLFVDSLGDLQATIGGAPISHEEKAITSTIDRPWYVDLFGRIRLLLAIVFGAALLYAALKLIPWA